MITCPVCGKKFIPQKSVHGGGPKVYCSISCRNKKNNDKWRSKRRREKIAKIEERTCRRCGAAFKPKFGHPNQQYCSAKCQQDAAHIRHRAENKRPAKRVATCEWCGKTFSPRRNHPHARFCCRTCSTRATGGFRAEQRFVRSNTARATTNITFVKSRPEVAGRDSFERVKAYLRLTAAERWAARSSLTQAELRLAEKMWHEYHRFEMAAYA